MLKGEKGFKLCQNFTTDQLNVKNVKILYGKLIIFEDNSLYESLSVEITNQLVSLKKLKFVYWGKFFENFL